MRQITAKHIEEKKARRNRIILGVFLIFIMFFSVVEYSFLSFNSNGESQIAENSTKTIYNGFEFSKQNGFWILNKDGSSFIFSYNPNEIVNYNFSAENIERYKNSALYLKTNDVLYIKALGRGNYSRTTLDKYGFPRAYLSRQKYFIGKK